MSRGVCIGYNRSAVDRYAPSRFPSVTHITRPLAGPYAQPGGTSRRNERADRTGLHRHGAVTDRVQFLVNAVNQALRPTEKISQ